MLRWQPLKKFCLILPWSLLNLSCTHLWNWNLLKRALHNDNDDKLTTINPFLMFLAVLRYLITIHSLIFKKISCLCWMANKILWAIIFNTKLPVLSLWSRKPTTATSQWEALTYFLLLRILWNVYHDQQSMTHRA